MRSFFLWGLTSLAGAVCAQNVDSYISSEGPIAKAGVLANIGSSGSKSSGAKVRLPCYAIHNR